MKGISQNGEANSVRVTNYNLATATILFTLIMTAFLPLLLLLTSHWSRKDWAYLTLLICIGVVTVWIQELTAFKNILAGHPRVVKISLVILFGLFVFIILFVLHIDIGSKRVLGLPVLLLVWAAYVFGIVPQTVLWIEAGEVVRVRRFIGKKSYKWDQIKSIAFPDSRTKVGVSIIKFPVVKHRFLEMTFGDGSGAKLKINREDLIAIRGPIEHNNAMHLLSESKQHGEEEIEYPV